MKLRHRHLASRPFVTLYMVSAAAVGLHMMRDRLSGRTWFPIAIGLVAAAGIIALVHLLENALKPASGKTWPTVVFFFICAALPLGALAFLIPAEPWLAFCSICLSGVFLWAGLGTLNEWPGFRPPRDPDGCPGCGYDLTGNRSGVCPECGESLGIVEDDEVAESVDRAKDYDPIACAVVNMGGLNICEQCHREACCGPPSFTDAAYTAQAAHMRAEGWTSPDGVNVYCPACSERA